MKTSTLSRGQSCAASRQGNESTESSNGYNRVVPYRPRFCENTIGTGAAARTASLVYQQLKYWSKHSQHHYDNKLWFYKSGEELAEELSLSVSTVRRALKRLLSLGLLVRQQWWKHRYNRVSFWHLPLEPETVKRDSVAGSRKQRLKASGGVSTTAAVPADPKAATAAPEGQKSRRQPSGSSLEAKRNDRSGQNGQFIQKKTSIEELTNRFQQFILGKTENQNRETACPICLNRGTLEKQEGTRVYFARCSCESGGRYAHLPMIK